MRLILTAASAVLLSLALLGCETTGTSGETTGSISKSSIKGSELSFGYTSRPHGKLISKYAKSHGIPEALAHAVISVESNYRANARGSAGEVGLMQIKPATARMMGYRGSTKALYNPETNIKFGMKYLAMAQKLGGGTTCGTILKYNAGHAAKRMNPVSKRYCGKVAKLMK
jgi:soluble lytic murein transglycosylase-like protein